MSDDPLEAAGRKAASLILPQSDWVHRRVQANRYDDPTLLEARVSIDFTIPEGGYRYLPLTVLPKWPPVFRLDYRDEDGAPIPLLTSKQNGAMDFGLMAGLSDDLNDRLMTKPDYRRAIVALTQGPETHLTPFYETVSDIVAQYAHGHEALAERIVELAAMLVDSTLMWFPVGRAAPGERLIVKAAYAAPRYFDHGWFVRLLQSISWYHPFEILPLRHVGGDANYHFELEAPNALPIRSIEPVYLSLPLGASSAADPAPARTRVRVRPEQHLAAEGNLAHVYISGKRPMGVDLFYRLAPVRTGFVTASWLASVLIAGLATAFLQMAPGIDSADELGAAVTLLALVPALIGYLVAQSTQSPLVRRYFRGVQALGLAAAAVPVVMALFLIAHYEDYREIATQWVWCVRVSWGISAVLAVSALQAVRAGGRKADVHG